MKKTLNEEIARIKGMMGKIMTEEFEDVQTDMPQEQPEGDNVDPTIKHEAMKLAEMIMKNDRSIVIHDHYDNTIVLGIEDPNAISLAYDYDVDVHSYPYFKSGRNWMSNGDPGYPDEGEDGQGEVYITHLKIYNGNGDVVYEGDDFTNMELPNKYADNILTNYFKDNKDSGY